MEYYDVANVSPDSNVTRHMSTQIIKLNKEKQVKKILRFTNCTVPPGPDGCLLLLGEEEGVPGGVPGGELGGVGRGVGRGVVPTVRHVEGSEVPLCLRNAESARMVVHLERVGDSCQ